MHGRLHPPGTPWNMNEAGVEKLMVARREVQLKPWAMEIKEVTEKAHLRFCLPPCPLWLKGL
jgi:tRNA(Glu) U13 pseudouridine synthase TruD